MVAYSSVSLASRSCGGSICADMASTSAEARIGPVSGVATNWASGVCAGHTVFDLLDPATQLLAVHVAVRVAQRAEAVARKILQVLLQLGSELVLPRGAALQDDVVGACSPGTPARQKVAPRELCARRDGAGDARPRHTLAEQADGPIG